MIYVVEIMDPIFVKRFNSSMSNKAAGLAEILARGSKSMFTVPGGVQSPWVGAAQTAAGAAGGAGLAYLEQSPTMTPSGREANLLVNVGTGLTFGNPWLRQILQKKNVNPTTGAISLENLPSRWAGTTGLLAAKTLGLKTWDQGNRMMERGADTMETMSQTAKSLQDTIAGPSDVRTPEDAARAISEGRQIGLQDYIGLAASKGGDMGKKVDQVVETLSKSMSGMDAMEKDFGTRVNQVLPHLEAFGNLAKWIPENAPKILAGTGAAALAGGGLYAAYNLLRDKLNYNRVKAEREAKQRGNVPKLAALLEKFAVGGMAYMAANNSPDQVAARHAAVNHNDAQRHQNYANHGAAAVARRKTEQAEQAGNFTPSGMPASRVNVASDGSRTVHDRNGRPVGTNRPVAAPTALGSESTYPRNPQLGAQIAGQVDGALKPGPDDKTPFKLPSIPAPKPMAVAPPAPPPAVASAPPPAPRPPATLATSSRPPSPPPPTLRHDLAVPPPPISPIGGGSATTGGGAGAVWPPGHESVHSPSASISPAFHNPFQSLPPAAPSQAPNFDHTFDQPAPQAMAATTAPTATTPLAGATSSHADSIMRGAKAAALNWPKIISGFTGAGVGGGLAYNNAASSGLSPSEAILPTVIGTLSGGMAGNSITRARQAGATLPAAIGQAKAPVMITLANDMYGAPAWAALKGKIQEMKDNHAATTNVTGGDVAKYVGGGALTLAGLAALYQATRAAKRVGDGEPLVNATSNNNVYAGGSGGTDNPNVGGKVRVTLPTRHPGDNETQVELPLENIPLSGSMIDQIRRDTKRRLRTEGSSRTIRQGSSPTTMRSLMAV